MKQESAKTPTESPYYNRILTIPNLLSVFRIMLLPLFVYLYLKGQDSMDFLCSSLILVLSAITDLIDGKIARKFNMISRLGKVLDPIADKLTHITIAFCLCLQIPHMTYVLILLVIKELSMTIMALYGTFRRNKKIWDSAQWYGKVCTTIVFIVFITLVFFPSLPSIVEDSLIALCIGGLLGSLVLYIRMFWILNSKEEKS